MFNSRLVNLARCSCTLIKKSVTAVENGNLVTLLSNLANGSGLQVPDALSTTGCRVSGPITHISYQLPHISECTGPICVL